MKEVKKLEGGESGKAAGGKKEVGILNAEVGMRKWEKKKVGRWEVKQLGGWEAMRLGC